MRLASLAVIGMTAVVFPATDPGVDPAAALGPTCDLGGEPAQCVPTIWWDEIGFNSEHRYKVSFGEPIAYAGTVKIEFFGEWTIASAGRSSPWDPFASFNCQENAVFGLERVELNGIDVGVSFCQYHGHYRIDVDNDGDSDYSVFAARFEPC